MGCIDDNRSRVSSKLPSPKYSLANVMNNASLHPSQRLISEDPDDGSCIFQIEVVINFEMYSVFMSYGAGVKILSPSVAVQYISKQFSQAAANYDTTIQ